MNTALASAIEKCKPDLLILDLFVYLPILAKIAIPWISLHSVAPNLLYKEKVPPFGSGYPLNSDISIFEKFNRKREEIVKDMINKYNQWLQESGAEPVEGPMLLKLSPFLNIYTYPEELDFQEIEQLPYNCFRVDPMLGQQNNKLDVIPKEFLERPGKLIYLSLGSWLSSILPLMNKILEILSQSNHKFIVSKGPKHDQIQLADNMWGDKFLNQYQMLSIVDLVITHGGNNTVGETLYFGKPMIIIPVMADQYNNAQRLHEKGLGVRIDIKEIEKDLLLSTIDNLLKDESMKKKVSKVSQDIRNSTRKDELSIILEKIAKHKKPYPQVMQE